MKYARILIIGFLVIAMISQSVAAADTMRSLNNAIIKILVYILGPETYVNAQQICFAVQSRTSIAYGTCSDIPLILFFFLLPGIILYAIFMDMLLFMGFVRKWTAQTIALAMAIFAARTGAYFKLAIMLNELFNNILISMLSLLFTMMIFWWVLGHILYGFRLNREILRTKSAISYLDAVGKTLESRV